MLEPVLPIGSIGEDGWVRKLTVFLEAYDVEVRGLEFNNTEFDLPNDLIQYYEHFGGIESGDFMFELYSPDRFTRLSESDWTFVHEAFPGMDTAEFIVIGESSGNDPVCVSRSKAIYLFSHDPLRAEKVFEDFNQYLRCEIIELQKLMGDADFSMEEELDYHQRVLAGQDIDYEFRYMRFC